MIDIKFNEMGFRIYSDGRQIHAENVPGKGFSQGRPMNAPLGTIRTLAIAMATVIALERREELGTIQKVVLF